MKLWLDAQLLPTLSGWINQQGLELQAVHLKGIWDSRHNRS
jgi:predicted nuclease of predicted toxin-antitoxin system